MHNLKDKIGLSNISKNGLFIFSFNYLFACWLHLLNDWLIDWSIDVLIYPKIHPCEINISNITKKIRLLYFVYPAWNSNYGIPILDWYLKSRGNLPLYSWFSRLCIIWLPNNDICFWKMKLQDSCAPKFIILDYIFAQLWMNPEMPLCEFDVILGRFRFKKKLSIFLKYTPKYGLGITNVNKKICHYAIFGCWFLRIPHKIQTAAYCSKFAIWG